MPLVNKWKAGSDTNYDRGLFAGVDEAGNVELRGTIGGGQVTPGTEIAQEADEKCA